MDRGQEIRELKLGASFTNPNARTVYHTLKYDFKPASVDAHKEATLETGSNSQVTVTVPHLDGSGVPNTIFKGSQRDYTKKECVLIFNRETNEIILEKLCSNIQVKKTRTDNSSNKPPPAAIINTAKLENNTTRHSTKTRVSTGIRKNVLNYVPKHSPLQGSPSYPHKSPQQQQQQQQQSSWNANNNSSTLPSITSLLDDNFANNQQQQQQQQQSSMYNSKSNSNANNSNNVSTASMMPKASSAILSQQQQSHMPVDDIGVLSSSESSSDSNDDSDSDSDSADSGDNHTMNTNNNNNAVMANSNSNSSHKKAPTSMGNHWDNNSKALLSKDLCLSDSSNSDSDN